MQIAIGFKSHSGWAVAVVVGIEGGAFRLVDRRKVALIEPGDSPWAKAPYHAAEELAAKEGDALVERGRHSAASGSKRAVRELVDAMRAASHDVAACAVLTPSSPMPDWTTRQILAVHFRMHKAEGAMFPAALERAVDAAGLRRVSIAEKSLRENAEGLLGRNVDRTIAELGRGAGPPWAADQKNAALAAVVALKAKR